MFKSSVKKCTICILKAFLPTKTDINNSHSLANQ